MKKYLCAIIVGLFALSIGATDWDFYGSARMSSWWWKQIRWYKENWVDVNTGDTIDYKEDSLPRERIVSDLQENSRFGARFKSDKIGFGFECGWVYSIKEIGVDFEQQRVDQRRRDILRLRRLYGEWFITDNLTFLVGQDYTPCNFFPSNQSFLDDAGMYFCGNLYTGRRPMMQLSGNWELGTSQNLGFKAAAVKLDTALFVLQRGAPDGNEKFPKIEGSAHYGLNIGEMVGANFDFVGGLNKYTVQIFDDEGTPEGPFDVVGKLFGAQAELKIWKISMTANWTYGQNLNAYGTHLGNPYGWRNYKSMLVFYPNWGLSPDNPDDTVGQIFNNTTAMGVYVVKVSPFDWITAEWGLGWTRLNHEDPGIIAELRQEANGLRRLTWYGNLQLKLIDQKLTIVPEWSSSDFSGAQREGLWHGLGLKIQLDT